MSSRELTPKAWASWYTRMLRAYLRDSETLTIDPADGLAAPLDEKSPNEMLAEARSGHTSPTGENASANWQLSPVPPNATAEGASVDRQLAALGVAIAPHRISSATVLAVTAIASNDLIGGDSGDLERTWITGMGSA